MCSRTETFICERLAVPAAVKPAIHVAHTMAPAHRLLVGCEDVTTFGLGSFLTRKAPVLAERQYRLLFIGTTLAQLAFGMMQVVQGKIAFDLTGKNSAVGLVALGTGISMLSLGPIGGSLSDRMSKRRLLMFSQSMIGLLFAVIGVLVISGAITIWMLTGGTLVLGGMFAIMGPTRQAWIAELLPGPKLASGVALQQLTINATRIVGPLLAGALVAISWVDSGGTYIVMTLLFAITVAMLAQMQPTRPRTGGPRTSLWTDVREGAAYVWNERQLRLLALTFVGVVVTGFSYQTIVPGLLENVLGESTNKLGLVYGSAATGGIVTTLYLAGRDNVLVARRLMLMFGLTLAASMLCLAMSPNLPVALASAAMIGASSSGFQLLNNVSLMQTSRPEYFGRVMSLTMMAFGVNSLMAFPIGAFADGAGERLTLAVLGMGCACVVSLGAAMGRFVPLKLPVEAGGAPAGGR